MGNLKQLTGNQSINASLQFVCFCEQPSTRPVVRVLTVKTVIYTLVNFVTQLYFVQLENLSTQESRKYEDILKVLHQLYLRYLVDAIITNQYFPLQWCRRLLVQWCCSLGNNRRVFIQLLFQRGIHEFKKYKSYTADN